MESTGYYIRQWDKRQAVTTEAEEALLGRLEAKKAGGDLPPKAQEIFQGAASVLS